MSARASGWITSVLLLAALGAGTWKMVKLSAANRELDRQNRAFTLSAAHVERALAELRESSLEPGSRAAGFTLLATDGKPLRYDPATDVGSVHLLFADPSSAGYEDVLRSYHQVFGRAEPAPQVLMLALRGYEETRKALGPGPAPYRLGIHAGEVYRRYGFVDGPGLAVLEGGILRERWRLPYRGDELPID